LDRVLMVVANLPWQKAGTRPITAAEDRLAVVVAALEGVEGVEASRVEIDRGGPSYTADTLAELASVHPGAELFLIVGSDVAAELPTWERVEEVGQRATLVVVERPGAPPAGVAAPEPGWRVERLTVPALDVSSSDLRARVGAGRPLDFLIPAPAVHRIRQRGLYSGGR
ncbi:MAG: nicotinate-nicotinamide nucleotide adenylyltransferase, partial [Acidimicrobiales bacterium]